MQEDGSRRAIAAAFFANLGIAVAKFAAFLITGAASMLAEAVHSLADTGNQGLLIFGAARAKREATLEHPFGFGRERYFWAFVVAMVLFSLGSVFAIHQGIDKLRHPHALVSPAVAVCVLVLAIALEGWSFRTAVVAARSIRGSHSWWSFIRLSKSPELPVVLLEDLGALLGLESRWRASHWRRYSAIRASMRSAALGSARCSASSRSSWPSKRRAC